MDDLINRQMAINLLKKWAGGYDYIETKTESAIKEFEDLPSAQLDNVWCEDCQEFDCYGCKYRKE